MKFAIGTAQIKRGYGILGNHLKLSEAKKIFSIKRKNIKYIDTAPSYGVSEKYLGKNLNDKIKIITKIDKLNCSKKEEVCREIEQKILKSFKKFNRTIDCILFHNEKDAFWLKEKIIRKKIKEMIKIRYIKKVGVSCYQYENIKHYCKFYKFNVFQVPLNILNINKDKINNLKKLKKKYGFEIHARSIFLQGILLMQTSMLPKKLLRIKKKINQIKIFTEKKNIKIVNYLISIIDNLNLVDCILIGFKNYDEFKVLLNYKKIKLNHKEIYKYSIIEKNILDPRYW